MLRNLRKPAGPHRGFTLIELMIVVCIIGLIASIAIPQFQGFAMRTRRTERETMTTAIVNAINEYWTAHGRLPGTPPTMTLPTNPPFPPDGSQKPFSGAIGNWNDLNWRPDGPLHFRYEVSATVAGNTGTLFVTTRADLDHNGTPAVKVFIYTLQDGIWQRHSFTEGAEQF